MKYLPITIVVLGILAFLWVMLPVFHRGKDSLCHVETFYTVEDEGGYSQAPYITGCSAEAKKDVLRQWCAINKDQVACN